MARKISKISVVDQVCATIKQDIIDGRWKEGDRLPTELEFSETFGVNRLSVRMALQKLSTLGLIETRVGEGSFVKKFSLGPFLTEIGAFYDNDERYKDVKQLRFLLETECMRLAANLSTDEEKTKLFDRLRDYDRKVEKYAANYGDEAILDEVVDADFAFHYQTIKMSHNKLYCDVYYMVQQLIRSHIKDIISSRMSKKHERGISIIVDEANDTHERIYRAIISGDTDVVKELSEEMIGIRPIKNMDIFD